MRSIRLNALSRPARGAWIEMSAASGGKSLRAGRGPQGARGLKCKKVLETSRLEGGRAPQGARGLK